jgi:kumamolisin
MYHRTVNLFRGCLIPVMALWSGGYCLAATTSLPDSIQSFDSTPPTAADPHKPYLSRANLTAPEKAETIHFEVALPLQNWAELRQRVAAGQRISPAEMEARFRPSANNYQKVVDWLTQQGFTIRRQDPARMAIFASGTVQQLQQKLAMSFGRVTQDGTEYTSATTAPVVPAEIASLILGINGTQPNLRMHSHLVKYDSTSGAGAPYEPSQLAQAYDASSVYSSGITGSGQAIAIVIDTFPLTSDLSTFWQDYGVNRGSASVTFIQVVSGTLPSPSGEETLDTEWSSSLAPNANVRVYATKDLAFSDLDEGYAQVYSDVINSPSLGIHQMTMSYGAGERYVSSSQLATDDQYYMEIAAAGVTIFASSGDTGATPSSSGSGGGRHATPEFPASDPNVTGVGGTSLTVDSSGDESSEVVWNNSYGASGGGTSSYFSRPTWQTGTGVATGTTRLVPDVACSSDPVEGAYVILNGATYQYGGTSWASPSWAAFCALFNQARASVHLSTLGILGPSIYPLIGTSNFRDITSGNNKFDSSTGYTAGTGYDEVTGIGVPDVANLVKTLTAGGTPTPIPNLLSAASVQSHAGTNYSINLPLSGDEGVECRTISGSLNIVCTFDQPMTSATAQLTEGTGSIAGTPTYSGDTVTIALSGVTDAQNLTLTLSGLNGTSGTAAIGFGVLEGDVNGDGAVSFQDMTAVQSAYGEASGNSDFEPQADINRDGGVSFQDMTTVRNDYGHQLP